MKVRKASILNFKYSHPYESSMARLGKMTLEPDHRKNAERKVEFVQKIWNKYEKEILDLFGEIYKIEIPEKFIKVYVSLILENSYSDPLTISLKRREDIEKSARFQRGFVYTVIHELGHYFSYTRDSKTFFRKLLYKIQKLNPLKDEGANLHYLIQAVEFGIIGEVFGEDYADYARNWIIDKDKDREYGRSAKLLKDHKVPMNKNCLEYISKNILK